MVWKKLFRYYRVVIPLFVIIIITLVLRDKSEQKSVPVTLRFPKYLVNTPGCKLFDMDPFSPDVLPFLQRPIRTVICPKPIVLWGYPSNSLIIDKAAVSYHLHTDSVTCCMMEMKRVDEDPNNYTSHADSRIKTLEVCKEFNQSVQITEEEFVKVECRSSGTLLWSDHFPMILSPEGMVPQTTQFWSNRDYVERPPSVIIIGIDSISRLHLMRSLPRTLALLQTNDFQEMKGFMKVGVNTFPNYVAFLTGLSLSSPELLRCWPSRYSKFDDCPFIWNTFRKKGQYVTAFVEDASHIAAFNYMKTGFVQKPADYYPRPAFVAHYRDKRKNEGLGCLAGGLDQTVVLAKYIKSLVTQTTSSGLPLFLHSWFTSAGHDSESFNSISSYDDVFSELLSDLISASSNHNAILIFLSDHGYWYGNFRQTFQGFYEESLPFLFIKLGKEVKKKYPEWQSNLEMNSNMLTTPFDLHKTFLQISNIFSKKPANEEERENGQSLFEFIPGNRTCKSAAIPDDYCRCGITLDRPFPFDEGLAAFVVKEINNIISKANMSEKCEEVRYKGILYSRELADGVIRRSSVQKYILIGIVTFPNDARFEARLRVSEENSVQFGRMLTSVELVGGVSRINPYSSFGGCTKDFFMVNYCSCIK